MSLSHTCSQAVAARRMGWALGLASVLTAASCTSNDVGALCQSPNIVSVAQPIDGEAVLTEAVNVTRDANCVQFSCLTAQGLPSYCTQACTYNPAPAQPALCLADSDCKLPLHCHDGICNDDSCPAGFFCQSPMATGSLQNTALCVRQTGCLTNPDCGDVSAYTCTQVGCYDSCLAQDTNAVCDFHRKVCTPLSAMHCTCSDGTSDCADSERTCALPSTSSATTMTLLPGAVLAQGICLPK